jgi:cadmium resistance protein CadD (predicted permease)
VKRTRFLTVLLGQLVGWLAVLLLSLVGYRGLRLLLESAVHWRGLAPVALGIMQLLSSTDKGSETRPESTWSVATIAFATCSDNLAVYTPLFARFLPRQVAWSARP